MRYRGHFFSIYIFLPLAAAVLWGCGKLAVQHPGEGHGGPVGSLEVVVENLAGDGPAGTIAPTQLTANQLAGAGYTLKLAGTTGRMVLAERVVAPVNGRFTLQGIPVGLWELTLTAYDGSGVAVLRGRATHRVRQVGGGEVSFLLTPAGLSGTGTVDLTVNWSAADRALIQSNTGAGRYWRMALYYPGTDVMVAGTESQWNLNAGNTSSLPMTLRYYGSGSTTRRQLAPGEYELRFRMWGGGLPAGTTLVWRDNLYIEPGRDTVATVTVPQLAYKPGAPTGFFCLTDNYTNNYTLELCWTPIFNATGYEVQIKSFTGGNWNTYTDAGWNNLSGGQVFTYTNTAWSPSGAPAYKGGSLGAGGNFLRVAVTRPNASTSYTARIRAVNSSGASAWVYLQTLANPSPVIISGRSGASTNPTGKRAVYLKIGNVDYETNYQIEFYNLRNQAANLFGAINENDAMWEFYRNTAGQGNIGSFTSRTSGQYSYNNGVAEPEITFQPFERNNRLCFRVRAVSSRGNSPWAYYTQEINTGQ